MFKEQKRATRFSMTLLGQPVCLVAFRLLMGIGKRRAGRLHRAARAGDEDCPVDERFVPKRHAYLPETSVKPQVLEFLQKIYNTLAEPLPEARSRLEGHDPDLLPSIKKRGKRPRHLYKIDADTKAYREGVKFLPPGSIRDYHELCKSEYPALKIGRKVFSRVT